jgi:lipopolysaccharide/colanic/teichoic acid biosynthesis glycosyltransferase
MYRVFFKRLIDILAALIVLIILSPVLLILVVVLTIANNGKPFFFQERIGYKDKIFKVIKFKTMNDRRGKDGKLLPDHVRLTPAGKFVRSTSLDELPQLLNVLIGEMSLVGPRPLLVKYLPLYNDQQLIRHTVKPGISGWSQVNGRNTVSWQQRFEHDIFYVENLSLTLDLKILFKTVKKVVVREGIAADDNVTMPPFTGNN